MSEEVHPRPDGTTVPSASRRPARSPESEGLTLRPPAHGYPRSPPRTGTWHSPPSVSTVARPPVADQRRRSCPGHAESPEEGLRRPALLTSWASAADAAGARCGGTTRRRAVPPGPALPAPRRGGRSETTSTRRLAPTSRAAASWLSRRTTAPRPPTTRSVERLTAGRASGCEVGAAPRGTRWHGRHRPGRRQR